MGIGPQNPLVILPIPKLLEIHYLSEGIAEVKDQRKYPMWQVAIFQDALQVLSQKLLFQAVSIKVRIHGSEHLGTERGVAQLPFSPNDPFRKFSLLSSKLSCSPGGCDGGEGYTPPVFENYLKLTLCRFSS